MSILQKLRWLLKGDRPSTLVSFQRAGQLTSWPRNYDNFSKEGFQKNVIVFRSIMLIAEAVGDIQWCLYKKTGRKKKTEIEEHPLLDLLDNPNPLQSKASFFEAITAFRLISGNSYILKVGTSPKVAPKELWPLRPDWTKILAGQRSLPGGYVYGIGDSKQIYTVDQITGESMVIHLKAFHPADPWYGMSPIEAAALGIDTHNETSKWNAGLVQNGAQPSGALVMSSTPQNPTGKLSDEQFRRLKDEISERVQGSRNAGKPLLLDGGLDWKQMSLSPRDMDWVNSKSVSAREIALAFGVPPMLLGIPGDNTYSNYKEARQAFYEETVIPLVNNIRDEVNSNLTYVYGDKLEIEPDKDEIEALAPKRESVWDRVEKTTFLTINEKREAIGYEPVDDGDVVLVSSSMTPLDSVIDLAAEMDSEEGMSEGDDEIEDENNEDEKKIFNPKNQKVKLIEWKRQERLKARFRNRMRKQVQAAFQVEGQHIADAVKGLTEDQAIRVVETELSKHRKNWELIYKRNLHAVGSTFGERVFNSIKSQTDFETKDSKTRFDFFLNEWINSRTGEKITKLEKTSRERIIKKIRDAYAEAQEAGEGAVPLSNRIKEIDLPTVVEGVYEQFSKSRAFSIARTEITAGSQAASLGAAKSLGIRNLEKEWVSNKDDRTRDDHEKADGQRVRIDEKFDIGGYEMDHPGDPEGPAEEIVNCRCAMVFHRAEGDDE